MSKFTKPLTYFAEYANDRIDIDSVSLDTFVTTDNLLQNKLGLEAAINLPPQKGKIPAFKEKDILVGNIRPYLKKIWFADRDGGCSADVLTFRVKEKHEPLFVYYGLFRDDFFNHMMRGSKGTKMPRGDKSQILDFVLPNFEKNIQAKIATVLSTLDKKIALNNRINTELEAMAKTLYDYWFVQFDFPISEAQANALGKPELKGKPYKSSGGKMVFNEALKREIPEGWGVDEIVNVIPVKDGTHDSPKPKEEGYHLITSKNLKKEGLDFENANLISEEDYININMRSQVNTGDILFSMIGSIGTVYKVDDENINFAIKNVALYKTSNKTDMMNFVYMYLRSYDMQCYMGNVIAGSIQKFIGLGSLRSMPILLEEGVISSFEEKTKDLFKQMTLIKQENQQLTQLRDWLLPMLMNGQVTVK